MALLLSLAMNLFLDEFFLSKALSDESIKASIVHCWNMLPMLPVSPIKFSSSQPCRECRISATVLASALCSIHLVWRTTY